MIKNKFLILQILIIFIHLLVNIQGGKNAAKKESDSNREEPGERRTLTRMLSKNSRKSKEKIGTSMAEEKKATKHQASGSNEAESLRKSDGKSYRRVENGEGEALKDRLGLKDLISSRVSKLIEFRNRRRTSVRTKESESRQGRTMERNHLTGRRSESLPKEDHNRGRTPSGGRRKRPERRKNNDPIENWRRNKTDGKRRVRFRSPIENFDKDYDTRPSNKSMIKKTDKTIPHLNFIDFVENVLDIINKYAWIAADLVTSQSSDLTDDQRRDKYRSCFEVLKVAITYKYLLTHFYPKFEEELKICDQNKKKLKREIDSLKSIKYTNNTSKMLIAAQKQYSDISEQYSKLMSVLATINSDKEYITLAERKRITFEGMLVDMFTENNNEYSNNLGDYFNKNKIDEIEKEAKQIFTAKYEELKLDGDKYRREGSGSRREQSGVRRRERAHSTSERRQKYSGMRREQSPNENKDEERYPIRHSTERNSSKYIRQNSGKRERRTSMGRSPSNGSNKRSESESVDNKEYRSSGGDSRRHGRHHHRHEDSKYRRDGSRGERDKRKSGGHRSNSKEDRPSSREHRSSSREERSSRHRENRRRYDGSSSSSKRRSHGRERRQSGGISTRNRQSSSSSGGNSNAGTPNRERTSVSSVGENRKPLNGRRDSEHRRRDQTPKNDKEYREEVVNRYRNETQGENRRRYDDTNNKNQQQQSPEVIKEKVDTKKENERETIYEGSSSSQGEHRRRRNSSGRHTSRTRAHGGRNFSRRD